jgi:hypothetical protein
MTFYLTFYKLLVRQKLKQGKNSGKAETHRSFPRGIIVSWFSDSTDFFNFLSIILDWEK